MRALLLLAFTPLLLSAQAPSPEVAAIRDAREAQNKAMIAGDVEKAATYWTDDVDIRRGLGAHLDGKDAYKGILEKAPIADTVLVYWRTPISVEVSSQWPLAYESGTWEARVGGKGAPVIIGRYAAQWVKREGKWMIRGETFVALRCSGVGCASKALP